MNTVSALTWIFVVLVVVDDGYYVNARRLHRTKRGWLSSGKPSGLQCAFNPCGVPGFCGEGRTCKMRENCMHACTCDEDSKHDKCVGEGQLTTTPTKVKCTFNPCSSPAFACDEGRICVLGEFCVPECQCIVGSTHPDCLEEKQEEQKIKTTPEEYVCRTGEPSCLHGTCVRQGLGVSCVCEKGYEGKACNISKCTRDCDRNTYCHFVTADIQICLPSHQPSIIDDIGKGFLEDACSDEYRERTRSEQNCTENTKCVFGDCMIKDGKEKCICDKGATGISCERKCCKNCEGEGVCNFIEGIGETCVCDRNNTGANCTSYEFDYLNGTLSSVQPKDPTWHYWVVGSCVFVLLLLICLIIVVPYYLWKHRVILVMKVVHYFQEYEDDDDREWDVFISYKSAEKDESFVVETLFPKLEKEMGFKTNVHFRDFIAGETISNNIIAAVQGSRRTIMVISPSYVTSEFTKFEYQVAQQEMLKRKHRIIPILLDDISECKETMDPMLKVILGSVTYIEWPKSENEKKLEKFWKRIELSMPKKKNRSTESQSAPSVNSGLHPSTKPPLKSSDIDIDMSDKTKPINGMNGHTDGNIYTVIDESKLNNEEIYDTLNESEMLTQVIKRKNEANERKQKQDELLNVLKVDL